MNIVKKLISVLFVISLISLSNCFAMEHPEKAEKEFASQIKSLKNKSIILCGIVGGISLLNFYRIGRVDDCSFFLYLLGYYTIQFCSEACRISIIRNWQNKYPDLLDDDKKNNDVIAAKISMGVSGFIAGFSGCFIARCM